METTTLTRPFTGSFTDKSSKTSIITKFLTWCDHQENDRLLWTGISLATHGCIITPIAVLAILLSGSSIELFALSVATISITMVLVTNLAALPAKITIPVFFLSVVLDLIIIAAVLV